MKKIISIIIITIYSSLIFGQMTISNVSSVELNSYPTQWGSAFRTKVYNPDNYAYNLWYNNQDVFWVHNTGYLWSKLGGYVGSDIKIKENISPISSSLSIIKKINGVKFDYINTSNERNTNSFKNRYGFIAQEIEKVLPSIVKTLPDSTKAIIYTDLIAIVVEAIKEQDVCIRALQTELFDLKCNQNSSSNLKLSGEVRNEKKAKLNQNIPNPFSQCCKIEYYIPNNHQNSFIVLYDLTGRELKSYRLNEQGDGSMEICKADIAPGIYNYALIIDEQIIDIKKMVVQN